MGICKAIKTILTLDNLYDVEKSKGRTNFMILVLLKMAIPLLMVLVLENDEIASMEHSYHKHYKVNMKISCEAFIYANEQQNDFLNIDLDEKIMNYPYETGSVDDTSNDTYYYQWIELYKKLQNHEKQISSDEEAEINCDLNCYRYFSEEVRNKTSCIRLQSHRNNYLPFGLIVFTPYIGCALVAMLLIPAKHNKSVMKSLFGSDESPLSKSHKTPKELLQETQVCK